MTNILKKLIKNENSLYFVVIFFVLLINLSFGLYRIEKKAVVDEQLWTFGRIQKYWNNIYEHEWEKTIISDKPGITVALVSGIGMKINNPLNQKSSFWDNKKSNPQKIIELEKTNKAFRLPILIFNALSLFLFFLLIKKIFNPLTALFSITAIGLSPLILGISTIVNPDSILWVFSSLSFLSFLAYFKNDERKYLYLSGIFLGLSILTKYVSNIYYLFFPFITFLEYSINRQKYENITPIKYLRNRFKDILILFSISFLVILIFTPALWKNPLGISELTIFSQAFDKIRFIFSSQTFQIIRIISIFFVVVTIFDLFILKGKILTYVLNFFIFIKIYIINFILYAFVIAFIGVFLNVYSGMRFFNFEAILASPKTSHHFSGSIEMLLANFYSIIFGISPVLLFFFIFIIVRYIFKNKSANFPAFFHISLFIFIYYIASIFNDVEATIRYQIIIVPLFLIISSVGIFEFYSLINNKKIILALSMTIILIQISSLNSIKPFYFSYSSEILPKKYIINPKDMGDGNYETAQYLNSLPKAKELTIWSDKDGVCSFFVGKCYNTRDPENFNEFDYYVVSSGRKNRTSRLISQRIENGKIYEYRIDKFYTMDNADWKLEIDQRPGNFIKIFSSNKLPKY